MKMLVGVELPCRGGSYRVDSDEINRLQSEYPKLDVSMELLKMKNWLEANPHNRKVNTKRFIVNWLNRARPSRTGNVTRETSQHYAVVAERRRIEEGSKQPQYASAETAKRNMDLIRQTLGMRRVNE